MLHSMLLFASVSPLTATRPSVWAADGRRPRLEATASQPYSRVRWMMDGASSTKPGAHPGVATGVLMVCLGNICRSPAAEAVLRGRAAARGLDSAVRVESCGTGGGRAGWYMEGVTAYHEGEAPDARMRSAAAARGLEVMGASRPLHPDDFSNYKYVVAMDGSNVEAIEEARNYWGVQRGDSRVVLLSDYASDPSARGRPIPDPYYGGEAGFENALDLIQDACDGLLDVIVEQNGAEC